METGRQEGAGTSARVYLELCGAEGSSGEHRLVKRGGGGGSAAAFQAGAVDAFRLHCAPLGRLLKARPAAAQAACVHMRACAW